MNRLILIGNGFDLAHGLRTTYKDFIFWYLDQCFNGAGLYDNGHFFEDDFIRIRVLEHYRLMDLGRKCGEMGLSRYLYEKGILKSYLDFNHTQEYGSPTNIEKFREISEISPHQVEFKSIFLKQLVVNCIDCGWVDIEQEYFDTLKKYNHADNSRDVDYVRLLNKAFDFLKQKLAEYLTLEEQRHVPVPNEDVLDIFRSPFLISDFDTVIDADLLINEQLMDISQNGEYDYTTHILNFNYTNTLDLYLNVMDERSFSEIELNHIHGQLNNPDNPIIFGFGDEHDKEYMQFEEQRMNELFDHIKSYQYLRTPNYRNLIRFLNEDTYQVYVIGHSCGLSDRTMFKEVFDHHNCKSIKIFHYQRPDGSTDFHEKIVNIGRHFSNKGMMRKLIVEFNDKNALPQS
ncbi:MULTISPECIES: AbiH family protein [Sphingobacterium]|uniref:AbiH family protein n=1 Tax=Sphingobacterium TaxID=28453 RepID=UPI0013DCBE1F|nr:MULTISPECIES: AbiH family protein [unclassified Sphingobacterium]